MPGSPDSRVAAAISFPETTCILGCDIDRRTARPAAAGRPRPPITATEAVHVAPARVTLDVFDKETPEDDLCRWTESEHKTLGNELAELIDGVPRVCCATGQFPKSLEQHATPFFGGPYDGRAFNPAWVTDCRREPDCHKPGVAPAIECTRTGGTHTPLDVFPSRLVRIASLSR